MRTRFPHPSRNYELRRRKATLCAALRTCATYDGGTRVIVDTAQCYREADLEERNQAAYERFMTSARRRHAAQYDNTRLIRRECTRT